MASSLQVPEGGEESWRDVAGQRRKTSSGGLQGRRGRDLQEGHVEKVKARTRPQAKFGTRVINIEGAEAAPVSFFIGNTSPKSNKEAIAKVIIQCANEMEGKPGELKAEEIEAKCMTHIENPRTKCWKLTVPNKWRETFRDDSFWPLGWSHRPWANRNSTNEKESVKKPRSESQTSVVVDQDALSGTTRLQEASM